MPVSTAMAMSITRRGIFSRGFMLRVEDDDPRDVINRRGPIKIERK